MDKRNLQRLIATGLGSGYSPKAPGTVGTLVAVLLWWLLVQLNDSFSYRVIVTIIVTLVGWVATSAYLAELSDSLVDEHLDPSEVVVDEWAGMFVALLLVPSSSLIWISFAFLLFRFFDISKLWPISWLESLPGATGVMSDDIAAGFFALAIQFSIWSIL